MLFEAKIKQPLSTFAVSWMWCWVFQRLYRRHRDLEKVTRTPKLIVQHPDWKKCSPKNHSNIFWTRSFWRLKGPNGLLIEPCHNADLKTKRQRWGPPAATSETAEVRQWLRRLRPEARGFAGTVPWLRQTSRERAPWKFDPQQMKLKTSILCYTFSRLPFSSSPALRFAFPFWPISWCRFLITLSTALFAIAMFLPQGATVRSCNRGGSKFFRLSIRRSLKKSGLKQERTEIWEPPMDFSINFLGQNYIGICYLPWQAQLLQDWPFQPTSSHKGYRGSLDVLGWSDGTQKL